MGNIGRWKCFVLLCAVFSNALAHIYSNSFISPNSADIEDNKEDFFQQPQKTPVLDQILKTDTLTEGQEVPKIDSLEIEKDLLSSPVIHTRLERSADPVLSKTSVGDDFMINKNIEESLDNNDVELSGKIGYFIQPSKTDKNGFFNNVQATKAAFSGEGRGALQGRSLEGPHLKRQLEQIQTPSNGTLNSFNPTLSGNQQVKNSEDKDEIDASTHKTDKDNKDIDNQNKAVNPSSTMHDPLLVATLAYGNPRQANSDIQDIITGLVKLLNGNVNVQANTAPGISGRPTRPSSTRINNRGPPRINDVPALPPDFDVPALPVPPQTQMQPPTSTRPPPPYPFDMPPVNNMSPAKRPYLGNPNGSFNGNLNGNMNKPLPDQVVPGSKRPAFYRPVTIPPWNRRRPPTRRHPIPPYKPMPPINSADTVSLTSQRPEDDILTLDLGTQVNQYSQEEGIDTDDGNSGEGNSEVILDFEQKEETKPAQSSTESHHVVLEPSEPVDQETSDFERNKEKAPKPDKSSKITVVTPTLDRNTGGVNILGTPISFVRDEQQETVGVHIQEDKIISPSSVTKEFLTTKPVNITLDNIDEKHEHLEKPDKETLPTIESSIEDIIHTLKDDKNNASSSGLSGLATQELPSITKINFNPNRTKVVTNGSSGTAIPVEADIPSEPSTSFPYYPYRPRPGIVLDDPEFKPGGLDKQGGHGRPPLDDPVITRPGLPVPGLGDVFDITVSAVQGGPPGVASIAVGQVGKPYVIPVDIENVHSASGDVITSPVGKEGFVSIDGKRTYINLFGDGPTATPIAAPSSIKPSVPLPNQVIGTGYAVESEKPLKQPNLGSVKQTQRKPFGSGGRPKPSGQPPVRIDTCIVGDDSTCDVAQHEICKTESSVSSCHCRPGTARRKHRDPCRKIVSVVLSLRVDKVYERRVVWANELLEKNSQSYEQLAYEAERAIESAMSMTPFSDEYLGSKVNNIYKGDRSQGQAGVFVNITLQLEENADTARPSVKADIQKHLLGVITRRSNNVGNSALWVDSPPGSVSSLQDLDECSAPDLHDCHTNAHCINTFGSFRCECTEGFKDPWSDNKHRAGRQCDSCSPSRCGNRGECKYQKGQEVCVCSGSYYGANCELDGEVLGVAIGATVAALVIIGLTLTCLIMWSRRWNREQKAASIGSPVFGYMATASNTVKTPVVGAPPYQLTLEDRLRWAQIADAMAQANHYAPEPGMGPTRPSSAMFGYPTLQMNGTSMRGPGSTAGTLPPVPLPRLNLQAQLASRASSMHGMKPLDNSSSSEEEDKIDLLGNKSFQVPRPKSRSNASIANQSGIYYDVEYEQENMYKPGFPMSTYGRAPFFRN